MPRRRALDWLLIVGLTGIWLVVLVRGVGLGVRTGLGQLRIAVSSAPSSDAYPVVLRTRVWKELEPGDRLEAVEGKDLLGSSTLRFNDLVVRTARERGSVSIRASRSGVPFETRIGLTPVPGWWVQTLVAVLGFLSGWVLLVRAPHWHLARRNFVLAACLTAMTISFDYNASGFGGTWLEVHLGWLPMAFSTALFICNAQDFTLAARPVPRLHRALAVAAAIVVLANLPIRDYLPHSLRAATLASIGSILFCSALIFLGFRRAYRRSDSLERRQIRWVMLGFYVGLAGAAIAMVSSFSISPNFSRALGTVSALGAPAGILISVIGYRWLDVDRVITATASYTILGMIVIGAALAPIPGIAQAWPRRKAGP